jgi:hypothetical protein
LRLLHRPGDEKASAAPGLDELLTAPAVLNAVIAWTRYSPDML